MSSDSERFYDDVVSPALFDLAKQCEEGGLSLLAVVEWAPGEVGRTITIAANSGFGVRMAHAAAQANGNVDSMMFAIMKHAREHGHSSIILQQLGIPISPSGGAGGGS